VSGTPTGSRTSSGGSRRADGPASRGCRRDDAARFDSAPYPCAICTIAVIACEQLMRTTGPAITMSTVVHRLATVFLAVAFVVVVFAGRLNEMDTGPGVNIGAGLSYLVGLGLGAVGLLMALVALVAHIARRRRSK